MISKITLTVLVFTAAVAACESTDPASRDVGAADGSTIKFLTYNVHQDNWSQARARRIAAIIDDQMPDIVTLQEVGIEEAAGVDGRTTSVRSDLEAQLSDDYQFYFPESQDPILVRRNATLRIIEQGSVELFECRFPRVVNWLRLEETESGKALVIYNTHLCPWVMPFPEGELSAEKRNQLEASELVSLMASHREPDYGAIAGGWMAHVSAATARERVAGELPFLATVDIRHLCPGKAPGIILLSTNCNQITDNLCGGRRSPNTTGARVPGTPGPGGWTGRLPCASSLTGPCTRSRQDDNVVALLGYVETPTSPAAQAC